MAVALATPRMMGAPASAASDPPHPARSITAHAMTAPAAFPLPERGPNTRGFNAPSELTVACTHWGPSLTGTVSHIRACRSQTTCLWERALPYKHGHLQGGVSGFAMLCPVLVPLHEFRKSSDGVGCPGRSRRRRGRTR
jgi:hypothetical protein